MPIHKERDQGRAETSPTLPLVIHVVKASIFVFESLNFKILKCCWEIYAIYLQAFNSLTTLRWWFHTIVSWYNRLYLAKETSLIPSFHRFLSTLIQAAPPVNFCYVWCSLGCEPFYSLNQWIVFLTRAGKKSRRSQQDRGRSRGGKRKELFVSGYLHLL